MKQEIEQLKERLTKQEKLASLGMLSAGIAHEIQNPLNFVINFSKMSEKLLKDLTEIVDDNKDKLPAADREDLEAIVADLQENMGKIAQHGERAISTIQGILLISRGKENEFVPSDLCRIVKEYVWLAYHAMRAHQKGFNVAIREHYDDSLPLMKIIPQDLSRAVLNVVNNALYAVWRKAQTAGPDYHPELTVTVAALPPHSSKITITDNGEGMTPEVKQRLYENFFTTKPIGHGTGLGMGIARDIVEVKHGGTITFDSVEGEGTTFTFTIPIRNNFEL